MSRAAFYVGDATIEVRDSRTPAPGPGEVQVAVSYTGVCGTDLHVLHGHMDHRVGPPGVVGHEMSGRIAVLGDGVEGYEVGQPVTVMPLSWCGHCPACRAGHQHVCQNLDFIGIDSTGSMQTRWNVPASVLVPLPPELDLRAAALVEPTAVAVHDVLRSGLAVGEDAVVVGGGPVGLLIAVVARHAGGRVVVAEIDPGRRELIAGLGIDTVDPATEELPAYLEAAGRGGAHVVFEVSGTQPGLDTALASLGVRGRLVVVGIHAAAREVDLHRVFWRELTLIGARVYQRTDFERAVQLVSEDVVPVSSLISVVEPLASAAKAFDHLAAGTGVMKVLVDCREGEQ